VVGTVAYKREFCETVKLCNLVDDKTVMENNEEEGLKLKRENDSQVALKVRLFVFYIGCIS